MEVLGITRRQLAETIARRLFTTGFGEVAQRLVLTIDRPTQRDLGGWCEGAVADIVDASLSQAALAPQSSRRLYTDLCACGHPWMAHSKDRCVVCDCQGFKLASAPAPTPQVAIAERIARWAHDGQLDRVTGAPYITHVERVVAMVDGAEAQTIAWLHDVVEDNSSWPLEALALAGISPRVIEAVRLLTRTAPFSYATHIDLLHASGDALAITVKVADLRDHLALNCPPRLRPRYEWALKLLTSPRSAPE